MMRAASFVLLGLLAIVCANPTYNNQYDNSYNDVKQITDFSYAVNDYYGNIQSKKETVDDYGHVGGYQTVLPDGRKESVTYTSGPYGHLANLDISHDSYAAAPSYEAPAYSALAYEAPTYNTPAYETPTYNEPSYETSAYSAPTYETPVYNTPTYQVPSYKTPVYEMPAYARSIPGPVFHNIPHASYPMVHAPYATLMHASVY